MPTTGGGLVYPLPTDPPDVPADLADLANSMEAGLAWVTTGFAIAAGWTLTTFRYKRVGPFVFFIVNVTKATTFLTVSAGSGDVTNTVLGTMPAGTHPAQPQPLGNGTLGRVAAGFIDASGQVTLQSVAGDGTNIVVADPISLGGCYVLG